MPCETGSQNSRPGSNPREPATSPNLLLLSAALFVNHIDRFLHMVSIKCFPKDTILSIFLCPSAVDMTKTTLWIWRILILLPNRMVLSHKDFFHPVGLF